MELRYRYGPCPMLQHWHCLVLGIGVASESDAGFVQKGLLVQLIHQRLGRFFVFRGRARRFQSFLDRRGVDPTFGPSRQSHHVVVSEVGQVFDGTR